jgi:hypothetical protein
VGIPAAPCKTVTLQQKRFLLGSTLFEITERSIRVTASSLTRQSSYEVPLQVIDPVPAFHRSLPLQWLVFAVIFGGVSLFAVFGLIHDRWVPDKSGMVGSALIFLVASLGCLFVFHKKKTDSVIFRALGTGSPVLFVDRKIPTQIHVDEFIAIIKERIAVVRRPPDSVGDREND